MVLAGRQGTRPGAGLSLSLQLAVAVLCVACCACMWFGSLALALSRPSMSNVINQCDHQCFVASTVTTTNIIQTCMLVAGLSISENPKSSPCPSSYPAAAAPSGTRHSLACQAGSWHAFLLPPQAGEGEAVGPSTSHLIMCAMYNQHLFLLFFFLLCAL